MRQLVTCTAFGGGLPSVAICQPTEKSWSRPTTTIPTSGLGVGPETIAALLDIEERLDRSVRGEAVAQDPSVEQVEHRLAILVEQDIVKKIGMSNSPYGGQAEANACVLSSNRL